MMSNLEEDDVFADAEEGKVDVLQLELHKEEKKTKAPMTMSRLILIFACVLIVSASLAIGIAKIIDANSSDELRNFSEWIVLMFMVLGGGAIFAASITGVWGGQRNIPIRMVSPTDSSVIGKGVMVTGYVIEECMDNEVELTIYGKDKEVIHEELVPIKEDGLFYTEVIEHFEDKKKSEHIFIEIWMVSLNSKKIKFAVREKKYEKLNIAREGLKIGSVYFFPAIYKDFADKIKGIFDPKRREKGVIEYVKINEERSTNVFFPEKSSDDKFVSFSFDKVAEMRQNALYFDIKRRRRAYYRIILFTMAVLYFVYPLITVFA